MPSDRVRVMGYLLMALMFSMITSQCAIALVEQGAGGTV